MAFQQSLEQHFAGAVPAWEFVARAQHRLAGHGFDRHNTIACVGTCRDELCVPLRRAMQDAWGEAFNFSSLAGMLLLGTAGFGAAHAHAPIVDGRERYLYLAVPHIGIGADGTIGTAERLGRDGDSAMCGALCRIQGELRAGTFNLEDDPDNPELALVRRKLSPHLTGVEGTDLLALTRLTQRIIEQDLEYFINLTVDRNVADYAVLTGIQIHGPNRAMYVHPGNAYACIRGTRHAL